MKAEITLSTKITDDLMAVPEEYRQNEVKNLVVSLLEFAAISAVRECNTEKAMSLFMLANDVGNRFDSITSRFDFACQKPTLVHTSLDKSS